MQSGQQLQRLTHEYFKTKCSLTEHAELLKLQFEEVGMNCMSFTMSSSLVQMMHDRPELRYLTVLIGSQVIATVDLEQHKTQCIRDERIWPFRYSYSGVERPEFPLDQLHFQEIHVMLSTSANTLTSTTRYIECIHSPQNRTNVEDCTKTNYEMMCLTYTNEPKWFRLCGGVFGPVMS